MLALADGAGRALVLRRSPRGSARSGFAAVGISGITMGSSI